MAKLEQAVPLGANQIDIIIRRIIGTDDDEIIRAVIGDQIVDRRANETEDAFIDWSKTEALAATAQRPCRVILLPEEALT